MLIRKDEFPQEKHVRNGHNKGSAKRKYRLKPSFLQYIRPYLQHTLLNLSLSSNFTFLRHSLGGISKHKLSHLAPTRRFILSPSATGVTGRWCLSSSTKRARHGLCPLCSCAIVCQTDQAQRNAPWPCGISMCVRVCTLPAPECTPTYDETKYSLLGHLANLLKFGYITKFTGTAKTSQTHTPRVCSTTVKRRLRRHAMGALNFMVNSTYRKAVGDWH